MEVAQSQDQFTADPEGKPSKVTDYKLFFPEDFKAIQKPELAFTTDENYGLTSFKIVAGCLPSDIATLKERKQTTGNLEHGIVNISDGGVFYQANTVLTGEAGIGFQVTPRVLISDYLHTHTVHEGEEEKSANLFSAFDLWSMGEKGAERFWLVGKDSVWTLVNLYGQKYSHYIKEACWEMAKKYNPSQLYDALLSDLIDCVRKCEYRLYRSDDSTTYSLVS